MIIRKSRFLRGSSAEAHGWFYVIVEKVFLAGGHWLVGGDARPHRLWNGTDKDPEMRSRSCVMQLPRRQAGAQS